MPLQTVPWASGWVAGTAAATGTRVEARGTGMYVSTDAAPVDGDFGTALALASNESCFIDPGVAFFIHASQPVVPAHAYTTGGISQVTNAL